MKHNITLLQAITIKPTTHIEVSGESYLKVPAGVRPNFALISHQLWLESIPPGCPLNGPQNTHFSYGLGQL